MSGRMLRILVVIALCGVCMGVLVGAGISSATYDNEKNPSPRISTAAVLNAWTQTDGTQDTIESEPSESGASRSKLKEDKIRNNPFAMKHKRIHGVEESQYLDYEVILEKARGQSKKKLNNQIERRAKPKDIDQMYHILEESKYNQEDVVDIETFKSKSSVLPLAEESDSGPSDGVMVPVILYKLQILSSALCSEWNHKFAVFKAFVMISCLVIGLVAMITLIAYFIDVRRKHNNYMKLKLLP